MKGALGSENSLGQGLTVSSLLMKKKRLFLVDG